jgi:hypothetical protein
MQPKSLSPSTLTACSRAAQNIQHLNITSEEKEICDESTTIESVEEFVTQYVAEVEMRQTRTKAWKKVYAFSQFAGPVLDLFKQANLTPECSIALGLVGMLLIQVSILSYMVKFGRVADCCLAATEQQS